MPGGASGRVSTAAGGVLSLPHLQAATEETDAMTLSRRIDAECKHEERAKRKQRESPLLSELKRLDYIQSHEDALTVRKIDEIFAKNCLPALKLGYRKGMRRGDKIKLLIRHIASGNQPYLLHNGSLNVPSETVSDSAYAAKGTNSSSKRFCRNV